MKDPLKPEQVRKTYSPSLFASFSKTFPHKQRAIIGQDRAVKALQFGLGNRAPGFNVYVSAPDGDEVVSVIQHFLEGLTADDPIPPDWCYINNFKDPYCPNALRLPKGQARTFQQDVEHFIASTSRALVKAFESEEFTKQQNELQQSLVNKQQELFAEVSEYAKKENFAIKQGPMELLVIPLRGTEPYTEDQFQALSKSEKDELLRKRDEIQRMLHETVRKSRELEKEIIRQMRELEEQVALYAIEGLLEDLMDKYKLVPEIPDFLEDMRDDILEHLSLFLQSHQEKQTHLEESELGQRYQVNVLVDNAACRSAPIVLELNPTYSNLFGKIERESVMGTLVTNFTLIREGALHRANGGYLILPLEELLRAPFSWDHFKRSLRNRRIEIEDPSEKLGLMTARSLKPEPIPLDIQIILTGPHRLFRLLYLLDDDFKKLFKVKAEFDDVMEASDGHLQDASGYFFGLCGEERLLRPNDGALARLFEHAHRIADHQKKLTARLDQLADLLREADYYAREKGQDGIQAADVQRAVEEKTYRSDLLYEKVKEHLREQVYRVQLQGEAVGQLNGLSVIDLGDFAFGRPSRITASVSLGKDGVIDIEREAKLGGPIHTKGVMILSGYLHQQFGQDKPLSLSVRLVFEQSYGGVEGDSASSAELYAILSNLAEMPLRQGLAVTGSVNQLGEIQAVGGINEKVEGFFEACRQMGLTGEQGVLIPASNVPNLMLKEEVAEAVADGRFRIWGVETVQEGLEILSGRPANTIFEKADARLRAMAEQLQQFGEETQGGDA
jgi:predicted ATP-dependent protease